MIRVRTATFGGIVIVTAVVAVLAGRAWLDGKVGGKPSETDNAVSTILEKLADSANELKGAEIETNVFFNGAIIEDGRLLTYAYTVEGVPDRPFDARIVRMARDQLNRESCADRIVRTAIDGGGAVRYLYLSSSGTRVLAIEVDRRTCLASE